MIDKFMCTLVTLINFLQRIRPGSNKISTNCLLAEYQGSRDVESTRATANNETIEESTRRCQIRIAMGKSELTLKTTTLN